MNYRCHVARNGPTISNYMSEVNSVIILGVYVFTAVTGGEMEMGNWSNEYCLKEYLLVFCNNIGCLSLYK